MQKKFYIETGLASDLNPVIKCSPDMYDQIIQECRNIVSDIKKLPTEIGKEEAKKIAALWILSTHPKCSEINKQN
jgi:hypothetical protein